MKQNRLIKLNALRKIMITACVVCIGTFSLFAQQNITVTGVVTDGNNGTLPGVNITVKGTRTGVTTNSEGKFSLNVSDNAVLQVSYLGYITQEISDLAGGGKPLIIKLIEDMRALDEVVVVGYGTQKKVNLTGAVDVISNERLAQRPTGNVSQSLQGLSPGMSFSLNSEGFQPGADMSITLRGIGSLNGGSPYILINGFPGDMNLLNPEDIESVSILKDAAASAIYGARAPYGVILITTKTGKKNDKMHVSYNGTVMVNTPQKLPQMLDSYTWQRVLNEAGRNAGGSPFNEESIDRIIAFQNRDWDKLHQLIPDYPAGADISSGAFPNGMLWEDGARNFANNNWWDIFFGSSVNQKHDLSVQGGTEKASYYFSGGYLGQNGVIAHGVDAFERINLLGTVNLAITNWWDFSWETRFSQKTRERSSYANGGNYGSALNYLAVWMYPTTPLYDGFGHYSSSNRIGERLSGTEKNINLDSWNNFKMEIRPLKGWRVNADFAYNTQSGTVSNIHKTAWYYTTDNTPVAASGTLPTNLQKRKNSRYYWNANLYTTYSFDIQEAHHFSLMAGMQFEHGNNDNLYGYKTNFIVEDVPSFQTANGTMTLSEALEHNATQGYFGRLNYNYREKYLFEANMRYDGTYVFRLGNRWGLFPSASVGWNLHRESFWEVIQPYINSLKIRGSWGQLGNQNVSPYTDLELIPLQTGQLSWIFDYGGTRRLGYTSAPGIVNRNLTWETATTANLGIETSFLNNRLQANIDLYERTTTNMVGPSEAKPGVLGATVPSTNNATLRTRGWDISLNWKDRINKDLSWFVNLNLSDYTSVVTKYSNPTGTLSTWYEGKEVGSIWGYTVNDLFRTQAELDDYLSKTDLKFLAPNWHTGDLKYEDIDGDGKVNNGKNTISDHGDLSIIGNDQPHYIFGLTLGLNYKGIDFSMLWSGMLKRDLYFGSSSYLYWGFNANWWDGNLTPQNLDYFRDEPGTKYIGLHEGDANINTGAYWPRPYLNGTEQNKNTNNANSRYLVKAGYARMQNIQLGYTLPKNWISKLHLEKLRVYFSGENLLTISRLPNGIDPEIPNGGRISYGADRIYSFGITVNY